MTLKLLSGEPLASVACEIECPECDGHVVIESDRLDDDPDCPYCGNPEVEIA